MQKRGLFENSIVDQQSSNNERKAMESLKSYLGESIANNERLNEMCNQMYNRYVDYDDEYVTKAIRRVIVINAQQHKKKINDALMKWRLKSIRDKITISNQFFRSVSSFKNSHNTDVEIFKQEKKSLLNKPLKNEAKQSSSKNKTLAQSQEIELLSSYRIQIANEANFTIRSTSNKKTKKKWIKANRTSNTSPKLYPYKARIRKSPVKMSKQEKPTTENQRKSPKYKSTLTKEDREQLFVSLYNDSKARKEKIKDLALEKEQKFHFEYTFKPEFKTKGKNGPHCASDNFTPFFERLKAYDQTKKNNLQRICQDVIDCLPKPKQCKKSPEPHLIPNGKDYRQVQREKRRLIEKLMLEEQGVTFKPILNDEVNVCISNSVIERNKDFILKREAKLEACRNTSDKKYTFKPNINPIESTSFQKTDPNDLNNQIGKRLYDYQSKYLQNLEEKKKEYQEVYPFKPTLSKNTEEILHNKQKIKEELRKKYGNCILDHSQCIKEEPSQKETKENINHRHLVDINNLTSETNSLNHSPIVIQDQEKNEPRENSPGLGRIISFSEDCKFNVVEKCENTSQKKTKVTTTAENKSDEKGIPNVKKNFEVNRKNENNCMVKAKPISISVEREIGRGNMSQESRATNFIHNIDYYDNLNI